MPLYNCVESTISHIYPYNQNKYDVIEYRISLSRYNGSQERVASSFTSKTLPSQWAHKEKKGGRCAC